MSPKNFSYRVSNKKSSFEDSKSAVELFHILCESIEIVNSTFTFPLVFVFFYLFIFNLFSTYNHVFIIFHALKHLDLLIATGGCTLVINYFLQSLLIHSSTSATKEAEETAVIVSQIINNETCTKAQLKIFKNFLVQIQYRNLKLQTLFFNIDWRLMMAVSSSNWRNYFKSFKNIF